MLNRLEISAVAARNSPPCKYPNFSARLRVALALRPMLQSELARILDLDKQTVQQWVHGRNMPQTQYLGPLCDILGCSLKWLLVDRPVNIKYAR